MKHAHNFKDITGQRFGYLTAIEPAESVGTFNKSQNRMMWQAVWKFRCDCGNVVEKRRATMQQYIREGYTASCGCHSFVDKLGNKHAHWRGYGEIPLTYFSRLRSGATRRGRRTKSFEFDLTIEYLWELFLKQDRKCAFTGEILTFGTTACVKNAEQREPTASLDRIDSSVGYVVGNVQWIHKTLNKMKQDIPDADFIALCKKVAAHRA